MEKLILSDTARKRSLCIVTDLLVSACCYLFIYVVMVIPTYQKVIGFNQRERTHIAFNPTLLIRTNQDLEEKKLSSSISITDVNIRKNTTTERTESNDKDAKLNSIPQARQMPLDSLKFMPHYFIKAPCPFTAGNSHSEGFLLVAIISSTTHFQQRNRIRKVLGSENIRDKDVRFVFFLGTPLVSQMQVQIQKESDLYNDIVQASFLDTYRNLTLKTITFISWVADYCNTSKFVLKMDDDMSLDFKNLYNVMQHLDIPKEGVITGNCYSKEKPQRNPKSKWYVTWKEFPGLFFPAICHGPSYLLSGNSITKLRAAIKETAFFWLEDVFLTGFVREKAGVSVHFQNSFFCHPSKKQLKKCSLYY